MKPLIARVGHVRALLGSTIAASERVIAIMANLVKPDYVVQYEKAILQGGLTGEQKRSLAQRYQVDCEMDAERARAYFLNMTWVSECVAGIAQNNAQLGGSNGELIVTDIRRQLTTYLVRIERLQARYTRALERHKTLATPGGQAAPDWPEPRFGSLGDKSAFLDQGASGDAVYWCLVTMECLGKWTPSVITDAFTAALERVRAAHLQPGTLEDALEVIKSCMLFVGTQSAKETLNTRGDYTAGLYRTKNYLILNDD